MDFQAILDRAKAEAISGVAMKVCTPEKQARELTFQTLKRVRAACGTHECWLAFVEWSNGRLLTRAKERHAR